MAGLSEITERAGEEPLWSMEKLRSISRGNEEFVSKMFRLFQEQTSARLAELEMAAAQQNFTQIGEIAHKMKPGLESFGIDSLRETVRQLEKAAEYTPEINSGRLMFFISTLTRVLEEMKSRD
jgi:HPt (histidine-containing phosphotransfer) domain-containing protein